jgi:5-methylcytosine-specific restriction endonuclease McrA
VNVYRLDKADDHVIRCGSCGQQVGEIVIGPYAEGSRPRRRPPRLFTFHGTGWHRGTDGVYRLERHAKDRVRAGRTARSAHPRVPTPEGRRVDHQQSPTILQDSVECGRCGSVGPLDPELLRLDGRLFAVVSQMMV